MKFNWRIDWENYLSNKHPKADSLHLKDFIKNLCKGLDEYKKYSLEDLKSGKVPHCHSCLDLDKKNSQEAKKLLHHLESINNKFSKEAKQIELHDVLQLNIKCFKGLPYRCFGYLDNDIYNIVYFDPKHEVYKE